MNTQNNDLTLAIIAALVSVKPALKVDESLTTAVQTAIDKALPARDKLTDVTRGLLPSLNGGAMFDTLTDDIVIHIPSFYRSTKAVNNQGNDAFLVAKHDVMFTLDSYTVESVRFFSLALTGLCVQPDWSQSITPEHNANCKLTQLVDTVIPVLQGLQAVAITTSNASKNYKAIAALMGLEAFTFDVHTGYGADNSGFDQHRDGIAITIFINVDKADELESTMQAKKGGTFIYQASNGLKYDVVPSNIVEGRQLVAVKYRFTLTKA